MALHQQLRIASRFLRLSNLFPVALPSLAPAAANVHSSQTHRWMSSDKDAKTVGELQKRKRGRPPKAKSTEDAIVSPVGAAGVAQSEDVASLSFAAKSSTHDETKGLSSTAAHTLETETARPYAEDATSQSSMPRMGDKQAVGRRSRRSVYVEGIATVTSSTLLPEPQFWCAEVPIGDLKPGIKGDPIGRYVRIPNTVLPEAEAPFYYDPVLAEDRVRQPHYGCKAVTTEFAESGERALLHRRSTAALMQDVASGAASRVYLGGWTGSGKSCALYALVAWARAQGWVVMYVPTATLLVQGGRYYRSDVEGDDLWDTPEAARHMLHALKTSHEDALLDITSLDGTRTLADLVAEGLSAGVPRAVVEAALHVKDGILGHDGSKHKTMVVIDDYNALYDRTDYFEPMHAFYNRPILPDELRLAKGFRVMENEALGSGIAVVASTMGASVSPSVRVPRAKGTKLLRIPRFDLSEVAAVAAMHAGTGAVPEMPSLRALQRALALTNGNARELRAHSQALLQDGDPLGPSLGYKAVAAARKLYATTVV
jgi:small subunit ribosomal protein S29